MMNGNENAMIPTTTPMIPHKIEVLAVPTFPGSPWAVKNWKPAIKNINTAKPIKIGQIKFNTMFTMSVMFTLEFCTGAFPALMSAKVIKGSANNVAEDNIVAIFLFIVM